MRCAACYPASVHWRGRRRGAWCQGWWSDGSERHLQAIKECAAGAAFRVRTDLIGWASQTRLHLGQIQERSRVAIQAIQVPQNLRERTGERGGVGGDGLDRTQQLPPVIAVSCTREGSDPLMGVRLQESCARPNHFSAFAPLISRSTDLLKATMRRRQLWCVRKCSLSGNLPGSIGIGDQPMLALPIPEPTRRGSKRWPSHQILLKQRSQGFHGGLIQSGEKTAERGTSRQHLATKERHEALGKRRARWVPRRVQSR